MAVTNFIWDELSDNVLLETDETDTLTARYTNRPEQFGRLISQYRIEDEKIVERFYHYDGESSTRDLTDANETVTDTFIYTAYGEEVARTGTTTNPFGYKGAVGYYTNSETDDIYVRARTYEPALGCWLSADPLGFVDGANLYRAYFVPTDADPSGTITVRPLGDNFDSVECGDVTEIHWDFRLDKPAPCDGWLVQRVTYQCGASRCVDCGLPPMNLKTTDFWEAWKVEKGQLYPKRRLYDKTNKLIPPFTEVEGKFKVTDTSSAATKNNTCGYSSSFGEIRFYCEEGVTGDLAKKWKGVILFWGEGCNKITGAGGVPATEDPPGFWARGPIEGTAARHAQTYWNCCDDCDPPFVAANGYPRKGKN